MKRSKVTVAIGLVLLITFVASSFAFAGFERLEYRLAQLEANLLRLGWCGIP